MRSSMSFIVISLAIVSRTWGLSTVHYSVELGGDNDISASYEAGTPQLFTPGSTSPQTYSVGQAITWDAVVAASGVHSNGNFPIYGMANIVFNLELHAAHPIMDPWPRTQSGSAPSTMAMVAIRQRTRFYA